MRDDSEGSGEDGEECGGEGSDEGVMKVILRCLWGFAFGWTNRQTFAIVELLPRLKNSNQTF